MINQQSIRVMLVDNHPTVLWGLERLIHSAAPDMLLVGATTCRAEALEHFEASRPDIVLTDLDLGEESGFDLLAELKSRGGARLIVFTGARDPLLHRRALLAGACGLLLKSASAEVILQAIIQVHSGRLWFDPATIAAMLALLSVSQHDQRATEISPLDELTTAERKVIAAVVQQKSVPNKVIAEKLHISSHTLRNHLASIYGKLNIHRRLDLVLYGMQHIYLEADTEQTSALSRVAPARYPLHA